MNLHQLIGEITEQLSGMWRFRWAALGLAWLVAVAGILFVYMMPNVYQASARVAVDTNDLLRAMSRGVTAPQNPMDAVRLVTRQVLTRPNLTDVAHETDLTLEAETQADIERIVSRLQSDIRISSSRDNIYSIGYRHPSRAKSVEVVDAIYNKFVESTIGEQGTDTKMTEEGLWEALTQVREQLEEADARLIEFQKQNRGYIPDEAGDFLSQLQAAESARTRTLNEIEATRATRDSLAGRIGGEVPVFLGLPGGPSRRPCSKDGDIASLENRKADLQVQYEDKYPGIERIDDLIADLEEQCAAEWESAEESGGLVLPEFSAPRSDDNPVHQTLRMQYYDADAKLAELETRLQQQQDAVERLHADLDKAGEVDQELRKLKRESTGLQSRYNELKNSWDDLQTSKTLNPYAGQVEFRLMDPPFASDEPVGPPRRVYLGMVTLATLGAGAGLGFALNMLMPAFFARNSLQRAAKLPVLGAVSMVLFEEDKARIRRSTMVWSAVCLALLLFIAAAVVVVTPASEFMRATL